MTEETMKPAEPKRYFDNPIDSFNNGACLDLRVRLATQMLTYSPTIAEVARAYVQNVPGADAKLVARFALDAATELLRLAEARGLTQSLDDPEAMRRLDAHAGRLAEFGMSQQRAQRHAMDNAISVAGKAVSQALNS